MAKAQELLESAIGSDQHHDNNNIINQYSQDEFHMTPLHYAVDRGHLDFTRFLLDHGADPNLTDAEGNIPLYNAIVCEHEEIIPLLINAKSNVHLKNKEGVSIASMATTADIPDSILPLLDLTSSN